MVRLNIGMVGAGVVGGGVYELLSRERNAFRRMGLEMRITKIAVRDVAKERDFAIDEATTTVVGDVRSIFEDDSIDLVLELMGGVGVAKEVVFGAIASGKHVVTANKALVASCLVELQTALAARPSVRFGYEAAVCGGIPLINTLQQAFVGDDVAEVSGIMNGTTNYMLTAMAESGAGYGAALAEAQEAGFAEADPTADVEGFDVQAKICLCARLAFGAAVAPATVPTMGISGVDACDLTFARLLGCTVKLLGTARRAAPSTEAAATADAEATEAAETAGAVEVFVGPCLVPLAHPFAAVGGCGNAVRIASANLGGGGGGGRGGRGNGDGLLLTGPGAGRYPTASSVVADLVRVASGANPAPFPASPPGPSAAAADYAGRFLVRVQAQADFQDGAIAAVTAAARRAGVPVRNLLQLPSPADAASSTSPSPSSSTSSSSSCFAVTTGDCLFSAAQALAAALAAAPLAVGAPMDVDKPLIATLVMRML